MRLLLHVFSLQPNDLLIFCHWNMLFVLVNLTTKSDSHVSFIFIPVKIVLVCVCVYARACLCVHVDMHACTYLILCVVTQWYGC